MVSMSSTLVETVSINYEDFNESFLTCGTCLCMYDGGEHTPKLLPCSHTVCLHCLSRIAAQVPASPTFRCPICRENITVPRGGVAALPPSFLVNQLLDLMASQRREVVPKCSVHITQELLFCETCDTVFCGQCTSGSHTSSGAACEHTVIPFSIAIKRMSEILLYKANECIFKLTEAEEAVKSEVNRLEVATRSCLERVEALFNEAHEQVEARRLAVVEQINRITEAKMKQLNIQLATIQAEKEKVTSDCDGLQYQVEVRNITQRIQALSNKLESVTGLSEPRENCFIACEAGSSSPKTALESVLKGLGRVKTTTTFPSLSRIELLGDCVVNLETTILLTSYDYEGVQRSDGGDPVHVSVLPLHERQNDLSPEPLPATVTDLEDGTYHIKFRPPKEGDYKVQVCVVDRPVGKGPLIVSATKHNNPITVYGSRGSGKDQFFQPVAVTYDSSTDLIYVVDTGNCRIKVLSGEDLSLVRHIENPCLTGRSCTGIACWSPSTPATSSPAIIDVDKPAKTESGLQHSWLAVVNWRTKTITRLTSEGSTIDTWTHPDFVEPIDVAVDPVFGHILVADNGPSCIFVFDEFGKFLFQVGSKGNKKGCFNLISSVAVGSEGQIVVADARIQVFSAKGDFQYEIQPDQKGKGKYGGLAADEDGRVLGTRTEKGRTFIQVIDLRAGAELSTLDSNESKLKRPSGLTAIANNHTIVVDLGNDCVKKYRYW
ncbi:IG_FLMN [Nesidiocoris tenuis]|uniref:IG_FLMN n=3 Tax=Nesidiocoris tenuis TaxID=355587 RepID=A0ABN7BGD1_9HEMI|nr:IG_FLMN [Nesidiocoris tenuis]